MNRREAMKMMAAGGAVAVGAGVVRSTPVVAAGSGPGSDAPSGGALVTPPPATFATPSGKSSAQWTLTASAIGCASGTVRVDSYVTGSVTADRGTNTLTVAPPGSTYVTGAPTVSVRADDGQGGFKVGDTVEFTWFARFVCLDATGVPVSVACRNYTHRYVNQANGNPVWVAAAGTPAVSTPGSCVLPSS